jgi:hypothetical protein
MRWVTSQSMWRGITGMALTVVLEPTDSVGNTDGVRETRRVASLDVRERYLLMTEGNMYRVREYDNGNEIGEDSLGTFSSVSYSSVSKGSESKGPPMCRLCRHRRGRVRRWPSESKSNSSRHLCASGDDDCVDCNQKMIMVREVITSDSMDFHGFRGRDRISLEGGRVSRGWRSKQQTWKSNACLCRWLTELQPQPARSDTIPASNVTEVREPDEKKKEGVR